MTREEAISYLQEARQYPVAYTAQEQEAFEMAFSALCSQQSTTKLGRSQWEAHPVEKRRPYRSERFEEAMLSDEGETLYRKIVTIHENWTDDYCSACGKKLCSRFTNYCPNCGRPLTEEAWAKLERRIGGINGTTD